MFKVFHNKKVKKWGEERQREATREEQEDKEKKNNYTLNVLIVEYFIDYWTFTFSNSEETG